MIQKLLADVKKKIANTVIMSLLNSINTNDEVPFCKVVTEDGITIDGLNYIQNYGFFSVPKKDATAVILNSTGESSTGVVIAIDSRDGAPSGLQSGEVGLFNTDKTIVKLSGKNVEITCPTGGKVDINNGNLTVSA